MTRSQMLRYPSRAFTRLTGVAVGDLDREALRLKVPDPAGRSSRSWILVTVIFRAGSARARSSNERTEESEDRGELTVGYASVMHDPFP